MTQQYFAVYKELRKKAYGSYWGKRILTEMGYLTELLYHKDASARELLEQAAVLLSGDYGENGRIGAQTVEQAEALLMPLSQKAKRITMVCVAHAHMDMNWMWGYQETVAMVLDTVRTMLTLMEEYPSFTFAQSQACVYRMLEDYAPDLLEQVRRRVKEGRWEVTASTWVENDKNMSGGEAMVRQILYAKEYIAALLDLKPEDLNIDFEPDTFGHSYNLPEILQNGGITRYYALRANDSGHSIFRWRGMSGAEVLVYNEPAWYNMSIPDACWEGLPSFCEKYGIHKVLHVYGVGDHGGGPTRRDLNFLLDLGSWPLSPSVKFGTYREYFDYLEGHREQLPVLDRELNYIFTGCYTSQSRIKMANRIGEARLAEAEILGAMARLTVPDYRDAGDLTAAWRKVLFNQFHDILPGSCIGEAREYAMGTFQEAMARAGANATHAMTALCACIGDETAAQTKGSLEAWDEGYSMGAGVGSGTDYAHGYGFTLSERGSGRVRYLTLFNVTQETRNDPTEIRLWDFQEDPSDIRVSDMDGNEYPVQVLGSGVGLCLHRYCDLLVWIPVPPVGYRVCRVDVKQPGGIPALWKQPPLVDDITDEPCCLENDRVKAVFDVKTMKCISFVLKSEGRELLHPERPACGFLLITEETGNGMTSWRVGKTAREEDLNETCCVQPEKLQTQGLRKELIYRIEKKDLKLRVSIRLDEGSTFLDFCLDAEWTLLGSREQGIPQLRFLLPCGYEAEKYRYAIPYGFADRLPLAQDVPAIGLGCALPKGGGPALCMLSDSKYGFRGDRTGLSLNLLRGSYDPDPYPEIGHHIIRMAVGGCDPSRENLALLEKRYIHPVITRSCASAPRREEAGRSLLRIEGGILSAVKAAQSGEGLIVRVYNPAAEEKRLTLSMPGRKFEAYRCDFLEEQAEPVPVSDGDGMEYRMRAGEVASFRMIYR